MVLIRTYASGDRIYSVDMMFRWAKTSAAKSIDVPVQKLLHNLETPCWMSERGELVRPIDVARDKNVSSGQYYKIRSADLKYPIFVVRGRQLEIVDGMHRLSKCLAENLPTIKCYVFDKKTLELFYIGNREEFWKDNAPAMAKVLSKECWRKKVAPYDFFVDALCKFRGIDSKK